MAAAWKCSVRARLCGLVRTESRQQSGGNVHCGMQISKIDSDTRDIFALNIFSQYFHATQKRFAHLGVRSGKPPEKRRSFFPAIRPSQIADQF
jgi:hypothetical protein